MTDLLLTSCQRSAPKAPQYAMHRKGVAAVDSAALAQEENGCNAGGYSDVHVQVVPSGGANPTVEVLWWSDPASVFVKEQVALTKAGIGADKPFEFTIQPKGRIFLVAVTVIAAGSVDVFVSGFANFPQA